MCTWQDASVVSTDQTLIVIAARRTCISVASLIILSSITFVFGLASVQNLLATCKVTLWSLHSCFYSVEHGCHQEQTCPPPTNQKVCEVPGQQCEGAAAWLAERIGHCQLDHYAGGVCLCSCLTLLPLSNDSFGDLSPPFRWTLPDAKEEELVLPLSMILTSPVRPLIRCLPLCLRKIKNYFSDCIMSGYSGSQLYLVITI